MKLRLRQSSATADINTNKINGSGGQDKTSTDRLRKFWQNLYKKKDAHKVVKVKDRLRKISMYVENWSKRQTDRQFAMKNHEKERLKKQKYRAKLALMKDKTNNSTKSIKKNALRRLARKYSKTIAKLEDEKKFLKKNSLKTSTPACSKNRLVVSQPPHAKNTNKQVLRDIDHSSLSRRGLNKFIKSFIIQSQRHSHTKSCLEFYDS